MNLTLEDIKSVAVGALRVWQEADGIHFSKCTEKQESAWDAEEPVLGERARATTGVRLDFHTDAKALRFCFAEGGKCEVHIDGLFRHQFPENEDRLAGNWIEVALRDPLGAPLDACRVTLVFPAHDIGVLKGVEAVEGTFITPHRFDCKILFIGDSITQGWAALTDSFSYAWRVSRHFNANSVIQGVGGGYFCEATFDRIDFDPDIVVVAYCTNDWGHYATIAELHEHAGGFLDLIAKEYSGKKIVCISPIWRDIKFTDLSKKSMGSFSECRAAVIEEIEKRGLIHIDGLSLVPPLNEFYYDQYLHPNNEGFSHYAENLIIAMEKHL
jgi:hypothetical protein